MKGFTRVAALLLLVFLFGTTAFAAEDCYSFTPPEGYTLVEGQTAMWSNVAQTANINIIVEKSDGVNPYDLTDEDIAELCDATAKVLEDGLAAYNGKVSNLSASTITQNGMPVLCIQLDSSYTVEGVELKSRQVQYIYFTKEHSIYVTATALTEFADADKELGAFKTAAESMTLQDELYEEASGEPNYIVIWVLLGAILGGAGGLVVYLLHQRKKSQQEAQ